MARRLLSLSWVLDGGWFVYCPSSCPHGRTRIKTSTADAWIVTKTYLRKSRLCLRRSNLCSQPFPPWRAGSAPCRRATPHCRTKSRAYKLATPPWRAEGFKYRATAWFDAYFDGEPPSIGLRLRSIRDHPAETAVLGLAGTLVTLLGFFWTSVCSFILFCWSRIKRQTEPGTALTSAHLEFVEIPLAMSVRSRKVWRPVTHADRHPLVCYKCVGIENTCPAIESSAFEASGAPSLGSLLRRYKVGQSENQSATFIALSTRNLGRERAADFAKNAFQTGVIGLHAIFCARIPWRF